MAQILGGKAEKDNLLVMNNSLNGKMRTIEGRVFKALGEQAETANNEKLFDKDGDILTKTFKYVVTATFGTHGRRDFGGAETDADKALHAEEETLLTSINISAQEVVEVEGHACEEPGKAKDGGDRPHKLDLTSIPP